MHTDLTTRHRADTPATSMAYTLLLPISNEHVTALRFDLIWLASYCITTPNPNPDAGIILLSYRPASYCPTNPTSPRADTPTDRQASHRTALRTDKPRADTPTNRQALYRYCTRTDYEQVCYCPSTHKHRTNTVTPTNRYAAALVPTSTVLLRLRPDKPRVNIPTRQT